MTRIAALVGLVTALSLSAGAPPTPKHRVTDVLHGVSVTDDYRWLESLNDPKVDEWARNQNAHTRTFLDRIPLRARLRKRVEDLMNRNQPVSYTAAAWAAGRYFGLRVDPALQQPQLIAFEDPNHPEKGRVLYDPNTRSQTGAHSIDWYRPSPDGKHIALSISESGSERGHLHVLNAITGEPVDEVIPDVQFPTAGGEVAWAGGSDGFYYTRYPRPGERPEADAHFYQQLWFHKLGTRIADDRYELGRDFPRIAEISVHANGRGDTLASVQNGDSGEFFHYLKPAGSAEWKRITNYSDRVVQTELTPAGDIVAISRLSAKRGKLLLLRRPAYNVSQARVIVPESSDNIVNDFYGSRPLRVSATRIYAKYQTGGPSELRVFNHQGKRLPNPQQLPAGAVQSLLLVGTDDVMFFATSYLVPVRGYLYNAVTGKTAPTALGLRSDVDWSEFEAVRDFAVSRDGTRVPFTVIQRRGLQLDGSHPVIVTGYGGYGISLTPSMHPALLALLERGAVYVVANLRGGGEFGEDWHNQGRLANKQNVFDDFEAVLRHLIARRYTRPDRLAVIGGSNGGLLLGALITQHPELVRVAVIQVGLLDMLRSELSANGAFNTVEYGTIKEKRDFEVLHAYSPYHRVKDGVEYPAVLLSTGLHDNRVAPMHSFKMAARLQAASASNRPILLRVDSNTGHGAGSAQSAILDQLADEFAFLLHHVGSGENTGP